MTVAVPRVLAAVFIAVAAASPGAADEEAPIGGVVDGTFMREDGKTDPSVEVPSPLTTVPPKYPPALDRVIGAVMLTAIVEKDGSVSSIASLFCQAMRDGRPLQGDAHEAACTAFVDASKEAFAKWRYQPAKRDGVPVRVNLAHRFNFSPKP